MPHAHKRHSNSPGQRHVPQELQPLENIPAESSELGVACMLHLHTALQLTNKDNVGALKWRSEHEEEKKMGERKKGRRKKGREKGKKGGEKKMLHWESTQDMVAPGSWPHSPN